MKKILFIVTLYTLSYNATFCQSFSDFDEVGQFVFGILKKMDTMSENEFVSVFSNNCHTINELSSHNLTEEDYRKQYKLLKSSSRTKKIIWKNIYYIRFQQYQITGKNLSKGVSEFLGHLDIYANDKLEQVRVSILVHKEGGFIPKYKYYPFEIRLSSIYTSHLLDKTN